MALREINNAFKRAGLPLELVRGKGYQYFVFDDGGTRYDTESVYVCYVSQMADAWWIEQGKQYAARKAAHFAEMEAGE